MKMQLSFLGAAKNVTGSRYLLEANGKNILIDCGLYQEHNLKERNWLPCQFPVSKIDAVVITHAHLDHCGLLPRLIKEGYQGDILGTAATLELTQIVLADCAKINEEDAEFKRKRHEKEGRKGPFPDVPLYTAEEAAAVNKLLVPCQFNKPVELGKGISVEFFEIGHILGASCVKFTVKDGNETRHIVFSGDVGRWDMPIVRDPSPIGDADYVVCESTYGDRLHGSQEDIPGELARIVNHTVHAGGNLIIPSFAIERTQDLIYYLALLLKQDRIPHLPVFIDSPMAVRVSDIFKKYPSLFDQETTALVRSYKMPGLTLVRKTADSKCINRIKGTAIIIAGSGMCTGGRIKHHLVTNLPRHESTVMFVGYQASGTLGRIILEGQKKVRILGTEYDVNANIERISGFSAHADRDELLRWLKTADKKPRKIFITHGEPDAAESFGVFAEENLGIETVVPEYLDKYELD